MFRLKHLTVLLMVVLCMTLMITSASAASISKDGLEVTLITDKATYDAGEHIQATLTVTNTNSMAVNNVTIENLIPNGYQLIAGEISKQLKSIAPGQTIKAAVTYSPIVLPETGDNSNIALWMLLLLLSGAGFVIAFYLNKRSRKALLSLLLCITLISPMAFCPSAKAAEPETRSITVTQRVMVGGVNTEIVSKITYTGLPYKVEFNLNYAGASGAPAVQYIASGEKISAPANPERTGYVFYGWSTFPEAVAWIYDPVDFDTYLVSENTVFYAIWESEEEDIDGDGLSYKEEAQYGTGSFLYDSDKDGLCDGDEVLEHKTNPLDADTDDDGVADGLEVSLGLNPLEQKTDGHTNDAQKVVDTSFTTYDGLFTLSLSGTPISLGTFSVEALSLNNLVDSTGLVSQILSIEHDQSQSFSNAELVFDYSDVDLAGIDPDNLTFLYLNEVTGKYEVVPSRVDKANKLVIAAPTHFSRYVVGSRQTGGTSFSYGRTMTVEYGGESIRVREVAATGFDVTKHGFAFKNFAVGPVGGLCYGMAVVPYLNYIGKLPVSGEEYTISDSDGEGSLSFPSYNIEADRRFYSGKLYDPSESTLITDVHVYENNNIPESKQQMMRCITNWFGKQHRFKDKVFDDLSSFVTFGRLKQQLKNDMPVVLYMSGPGDGWPINIKKIDRHFVLICGVYQSIDSGDYYISIYDSNAPGRMKYIKASSKYIKASSIIGTYLLGYENYTIFRLANITIPDGPYVPHEFTVSGRVLGLNNTGIPQAKVTITDDDGYRQSVFTSPAGGFNLFEVPNGRYQIVIEADGYKNGTIDDVNVSGDYVVLDAISLEPLVQTQTSDIRGVITIADGDTDMTNNLPLEGARVTLEVTSYMSKAEYTAANGEYTLQGIPEGTYTITVSKDGYIPVTQSLTVRDGDDIIYNIAIESISQQHSGIGFASGVIKDARTGRPVQALTLNVRRGLNNTDGKVLQTLYTDVYGRYTTIGIEAGNYTIEIVDNRSGITASQRYTTTSFNIKVLGNMTIGNQDGSVSNGLISGELRIVLKWGQSPRDLDSHLTGTMNGGIHVYYRNKKANVNGSKLADLDLDDTTSYGPETVTIHMADSGTFRYSVHNYSNRNSYSSNALAKSGAQVEVYQGNDCIATYHVPNMAGTVWTVFDFKDGVITPVNTMTYVSNSSKVGSFASTYGITRTVEYHEDDKDYN